MWSSFTTWSSLPPGVALPSGVALPPGVTLPRGVHIALPHGIEKKKRGKEKKKFHSYLKSDCSDFL